MTTLLIVDDNETNRYLLEVLFKGNGYGTHSATNGNEALKIAEKHSFDLVISDILMPEMDGFALCRQMKKDKQLQTVPFIFYTATYTGKKDEEFALSLGADKFLVKPLPPEILLNVLQETLSTHQPLEKTATQNSHTEEKTYFRMYNETLVRKLEDKMVQVEHANKRLNMFYDVSTSLASIQPLEELVSYALSTVIVAMGYTHANYFSYQEDSKKFHLLEAVGHSKEDVDLFRQKLVFTLGEPLGLVGLVGQSEESLILPDTHADPRWIILDESIRSALFLPVLYEDKLLGVVSFLSTKIHAFDNENTRDVTTLVNNVAIAINNARLYYEQQQYTDRLEAEVAARTAELSEALKKAKAADRLKSQFVSDVNHELRTPLGNIKLYLTLLERGQQEKWPQYMTILNRETERLQYLIEDMLDLSSLDSEKIAANLCPTNLNDLINNLVIDRSELAQDKGIHLVYIPSDALPLAQADPQLLFQVLSNLLANAINYTQMDGFIEIYTETAVSDTNSWVTIHVKDTGPGISEKEQQAIFDRFYRGEAGQNSGGAGTGLGLAICREIIRLHGGKISVKSEYGQGSTFIIWLQEAKS